MDTLNKTKTLISTKNSTSELHKNEESDESEETEQVFGTALDTLNIATLNA